ncbi:MAG: TerB family tellurite resistance protein [Mariprofundus sp.]
MIEMMRMDRDEHVDEWRVIAEVLQSRFDLAPDETAELVRLAGQEEKGPSDYYQFTSLINKGCSMQEKATIVEHLWQIAYADGQLDKHEEYLVRRISGLLGIDNQEFIAAKHRARDSA